MSVQKHFMLTEKDIAALEYIKGSLNLDSETEIFRKLLRDTAAELKKKEGK